MNLNPSEPNALRTLSSSSSCKGLFEVFEGTGEWSLSLLLCTSVMDLYLILQDKTLFEYMK
jgi:hypothetical protein